MPYLPLCALEAFPKNQPQHHIWRGICSQMTHHNTKKGAELQINCPLELTVAPSPTLQVNPRGAYKCTLGRQQKSLYGYKNDNQNHDFKL